MDAAQDAVPWATYEVVSAFLFVIFIAAGLFYFNWYMIFRSNYEIFYPRTYGGSDDDGRVWPAPITRPGDLEMGNRWYGAPAPAGEPEEVPRIQLNERRLSLLEKYWEELRRGRGGRR